MTLTAEGAPGASPVTVWSLEMTRPDELQPVPTPTSAPTLATASTNGAWLSRTCYRAVGADWQWVDRAAWTPAQWRAWVDRPEHHLVTAWLDADLAGYYELEQQDGGAVEIAYFGLTRAKIGRGIGGWLLSESLAHAWRLEGTSRVWVHTCSLDAPAALANYESRGMRRFAEHIEWRILATD